MYSQVPPSASFGKKIFTNNAVKVAKRRLRMYEVGISYRVRTYEEGKKINW
jgi:hypothetical protein